MVVDSCAYWFVLIACFASFDDWCCVCDIVLFRLIVVVVTPRRALLLVVFWCFALGGLFGVCAGWVTWLLLDCCICLLVGLTCAVCFRC